MLRALAHTPVTFGALKYFCNEMNLFVYHILIPMLRTHAAIARFVNDCDQVMQVLHVRAGAVRKQVFASAYSDALRFKELCEELSASAAGLRVFAALLVYDPRSIAAVTRAHFEANACIPNTSSMPVLETNTVPMLATLFSNAVDPGMSSVYNYQTTFNNMPNTFQIHAIDTSGAVAEWVQADDVALFLNGVLCAHTFNADTDAYEFFVVDDADAVHVDVRVLGVSIHTWIMRGLPKGNLVSEMVFRETSASGMPRFFSSDRIRFAVSPSGTWAVAVCYATASMEVFTFANDELQYTETLRCKDADNKPMLEQLLSATITEHDTILVVTGKTCCISEFSRSGAHMRNFAHSPLFVCATICISKDIVALTTGLLVSLYSYATGQILKTIYPGNPHRNDIIRAMSLTPDARYAFVFSIFKGCLRFDLETGNKVRVFEFDSHSGNRPTCMLAISDRHIALGFMGGVRVLDDVAKTQYIVASCELPLQLAWVNGRLFVQHHHKKVCVYK